MRAIRRGPAGRRRYPAWCGIGPLFVAMAASLATAGCSASSYNDLSKTAHEVPVPKGLTVDHQDQFTNGGIGGTKQVNLVYSNPAGDCEALRAGWVAALEAAHRHYTIVGTARLRFTLPDNNASVAIDIDWDGTFTCRLAAINVEQK